jgi:hypothetical protein
VVMWEGIVVAGDNNHALGRGNVPSIKHFDHFSCFYIIISLNILLWQTIKIFKTEEIEVR